MKKQPKVIVLKGGIRFKGNIIKNGLDTSRLVNLIICFNSPEKLKSKGFQFPPNLFYIHELTFNESVGILIHKFKYKPEEAKKVVKEWKKAIIKEEIKRDKISGEYEKIVEEKGKKYKIGEPDIIIIAGFKKTNITLVHTHDKGFEKTCEDLGMQIMPTPQRDIKKENQIKRKLNGV